MRAVLLGTGGSSGVPQIGGADGTGDWGNRDPAEPRNRRTRSSVLIDRGRGRRLLVDTSPDLREQLLACGIAGVDAILFTHAHADHISGIDDVRALNRAVDRPLDAYATAETLAELTRRFDYAFKPWDPPGFFRPVLLPHPVEPGQTIEACDGLQARLFRQDHGFISSLGARVGDFAYSTDVVGLDEAAFDVLEGVDTWVVDCFQRSPGNRAHAHLELVLGWAERVGARRTVPTHMGFEMDFGWLRENLPPSIEPGFDGMILEIPDEDHDRSGLHA